MPLSRDKENICQKATTLQELITLKNKTQLSSENIHSCYVPRQSLSTPPINEKIKRFFDLSHHDESKKIILAGPKGAGKTSLVCHLYHNVLDHFHIIPVHLLRTLDPMDISQVDILFCLLNHLIGFLSSSQKRIDPFVLNTIYQCLNDEQIIELIKFKKSEAGDEEGTKIGFVKTIIGAIVEALSTTSGNVREHIRDALAPTIRLILKGIQEIVHYINRINQNENKKLLIIFDDLDQFDMKTADLFFQNHLPITERLHVHIIYSMPDYIRFSHYFNTLVTRMDCIFYMRMIPVHDQTQHRFEKGQLFIKAIIANRIDLQLIPEPILDRLIVLSGGVLYQVFDMIIDTALETLIMAPSSPCLIQEAFENVHRRYQHQLLHQMDSDQVELLSKLNLSKPSWSDNKNIQQLMAQNILIEYECLGDVWFDIHPLAKAYINRHPS